MHRLKRELQGILVAAVPVQGPTLQGMTPLPRLGQRYIAIGYADDNKPSITSMEAFIIDDHSLAVFEKASGSRSKKSEMQIPPSRKVEKLTAPGRHSL